MPGGVWKLAWLEIKIFVREPLGVFGTVLPALMFIVFGRLLGRQMQGPSPAIPPVISSDLPILASMLLATSAVLSLVAIIAIYREGGILRRLRATPLGPFTILAAHVIVKLFFTAVTLALMVVGGRRFYPVDASVPLWSYAIALLFSTLTILSLGFVIASLVPTARFAQPLGTLIIYPMLAISGLFVPLASLSPTLRAAARALPLTYAVSLLRGIWRGDAWSRHLGDVAILMLMFALLSAVSARVFRWE